MIVDIDIDAMLVELRDQRRYDLGQTRSRFDLLVESKSVLVARTIYVGETYHSWRATSDADTKR